MKTDGLNISAFMWDLAQTFSQDYVEAILELEISAKGFSVKKSDLLIMILGMVFLRSGELWTSGWSGTTTAT